ncbi:MAG: hypothetical protein ACKVRP_05470 [Bacteroidota bacterium]
MNRKALILILGILTTLSCSVSLTQIENYQYYPDCLVTTDVYGFQNVLDPYRNPSNAYLYIVAANVLDDGENDRWEMFTGTADIGIHVYGGENFDILLNMVRLYGPYDEGVDDDGSLKYEWDDYCSMRYNNFALMQVSGYLWRCVRILAVEGDDQEWIQGSDDVVFDAIVCLDQIGTDVTRVDGTCDIPGVCATMWLSVRDCTYPDCGIFWR